MIQFKFKLIKLITYHLTTLNLSEEKKKAINNEGETSMYLGKQWYKLGCEFLGFEHGRSLDYL